jgi:type IV secretion system protein VirB6
MGAGTAVIVGLFALFRAWIDGAVNGIADNVWNTLTGVAGAAGLGAVTLWIMVNGYLIVTGASREPFTAYLLKSFRVFAFMLLATGAAAINGNLRVEVQWIRDVLGRAITGDATPIWTQLDNNLNAMGVAVAGVALLTGIGGNASPGGDAGETWVAFATTVAVGAPVVTLSVTVLTLEAAILLGTALAPIFFFLGIFQRFADWPWSWLKFMFATLVSASVMAALSVTALGVFAGFLTGGVAMFVAGMGMTTVAGAMAVGGILVSALMISIPSMVMRLFSLASEGAARDVLGTGGGRAGGSRDPRGKGDGSTGGGMGGVDPRLAPSSYRGP